MKHPIYIYIYIYINAKEPRVNRDENSTHFVKEKLILLAGGDELFLIDFLSSSTMSMVGWGLP